MPIDITAEQLLTLDQASRFLPNRPHLSTLYRWRTAGVRGVYLDTCLIGGTRYTSVEALQRFMEQLTLGVKSEQVQATSAQRQKQATAARRRVRKELFGE